MCPMALSLAGASPMSKGNGKAAPPAARITSAALARAGSERGFSPDGKTQPWGGKDTTIRLRDEDAETRGSNS